MEQDRHAAITHEVVEIIARKASEGEVRELISSVHEGMFTFVSSCQVAPRCYRHLRGLGIGLADADNRWQQITMADKTGYKGMVVHAPIELRPAAERFFSENGLLDRIAGKTQQTKSSIVCLESLPPDHDGNTLHRCVSRACCLGFMHLNPFVVFCQPQCRGFERWRSLCAPAPGTA
jgi:hypothetical protein